MIYAKAAALLVLVLLLFGGGYHLGGMASKTKLEGVEAAQAENTAKAVLAERASAAAELVRVNSLLKGYQDAPPDPAVVSVGSRVLQYARIADCPMPSTGAHPAAVIGAGALPRSDPEFERLLQAAFDAADHDAKELTTLQAAWPH